MKNDLTKIREQQKETWNTFSSGWKKWDDLTMEWLKPMGDEIIRMIHPEKSDMILDVASGTGEPGLSIAALNPNGKVILTDLAEDMLLIAKENATQKGLQNIETMVCDVCELPFADNTFDAISCRFGFMFFPDMHLAANELVRVLKPSGRIATSVWSGPEKNFWVTVTMDAINRNLGLPAPSPGTPGIFRCAGDGFITGLFEQAGLRNIVQTEIQSKLNSHTADNFWNMLTEIAAPVVSGLSKADEIMKDKIKEDVFKALHKQYPDGDIRVDSGAYVIYGEK